MFLFLNSSFLKESQQNYLQYFHPKHCPPKWSCPLRVFLVNKTKFMFLCGFGNIYWRNSWWNISFFVQWKSQYKNFDLVYFAEIFFDYNKSIQRFIRYFPNKKLKNSKIFPNRYLKKGIICSAKKYVITVDRKNILWGETII